MFNMFKINFLKKSIKRNKLIYIFASLLNILIFSCNNANLNLKDLAVYNMDSTNVEEIYLPDSLQFDYNKSIDSTSVEIIPLKVNASSSFVKISRLFFLDSTIVIFDDTMESVIIFNKKGE